MSVPKCRECEFCKPYVDHSKLFICTHPLWENGNIICGQEISFDYFPQLKTSPKWCPSRKEKGVE